MDSTSRRLAGSGDNPSSRVASRSLSSASPGAPGGVSSWATVPETGPGRGSPNSAAPSAARGPSSPSWR